MEASKEDRCYDCRRNPCRDFPTELACVGCEINPYDFYVLPREVENGSI